MAKVKIPKQVVGVKIPKQVRKRARKALKLAESPIVREAAIAALGAAGVAKGAKELADGKGGRRRRGKAASFDVEGLTDAIRAAAMDGIRTFLEGLEDGLRTAAAATGDAAEAMEPGSKKGGNGRASRGKRDDEDEKRA